MAHAVSDRDDSVKWDTFVEYKVLQRKREKQAGVLEKAGVRRDVKAKSTTNQPSGIVKSTTKATAGSFRLSKTALLKLEKDMKGLDVDDSAGGSKHHY